MTGPRNDDPTRVTSQSAVQNPNRKVWLLASGLLALVAIVLFAFSIPIVACTPDACTKPHVTIASGIRTHQ